MRTPDDLLAEISDELNRKISSAVGSLRSASPSLKVQPGFPFTLVRQEVQERVVDAEITERPAPVIYEIGSASGADFIDFYLGNPTTTNGGYPVRLDVDTEARQFYFLKLVADVEASCVCQDEGPPASWVCVDTDVTTTSVTVERHMTIPEQISPMTSPPCGDDVEGGGWGSFYGSPSGQYTVYLPLLCLDYTGGTPVSYSGGDLAEIVSKNPMYVYLRDTALQGGDSSRLWWSDGSAYSVVNTIQGGDPGAVSVGGIYAQALDPEDSEYVLSSL